jgi:hypothetical protein
MVLSRARAERVRLLKKARRAMTAVGRKAAATLNSKKAARRISASCGGRLGKLVSAVRADPL